VMRMQCGNAGAIASNAARLAHRRLRSRYSTWRSKIQCCKRP
jgi:hypothetical protein